MAMPTKLMGTVGPMLRQHPVITSRMASLAKAGKVRLKLGKPKITQDDSAPHHTAGSGMQSKTGKTAFSEVVQKPAAARRKLTTQTAKGVGGTTTARRPQPPPTKMGGGMMRKGVGMVSGGGRGPKMGPSSRTKGNRGDTAGNGRQLRGPMKWGWSGRSRGKGKGMSDNDGDE